jgi:hypothetical protein
MDTAGGGAAVAGAALDERSPLHRQGDVGEGDVGRITGEEIAPVFSPAAQDESGLAQGGQDLDQIVRRKPLCRRQFLDLSHLAEGVPTRQLRENLTSVFSL